MAEPIMTIASSSSILDLFSSFRHVNDHKLPLGAVGSRSQCDRQFMGFWFHHWLVIIRQWDTTSLAGCASGPGKGTCEVRRPSSSQTKDRKSQLSLSGGGTFKGDQIESMFNQMAVKKETLRGFVTKLAKRTSAKLNGLNYCQIGQD